MPATDFDAPTAVGNVLWGQWRELGVPAAAAPVVRLIDPEALILYTAIFTEAHPDDRLRDGAISWCVRYHQLVSTARLKRLRGLVRIGADDAFERFASQVGAHVKRLPWPTKDAPSWTPSTKVELPRLDGRQTLLRVRCRAMFGVNAKAEAVAFMASVGDHVMLAAIERHTGYSRTQIADGLSGLEHAGWVYRTTVGNATRYSLAAPARNVLMTPMVEHQVGPMPFDVLRMSSGPTWIDWQSRFELLWHVIDASNALDRGDVLGSLAHLRDLEDEFRAAHMSVPRPLTDASASTEEVEELHEFIRDAVTNVGGRGFLP